MSSSVLRRRSNAIISTFMTPRHSRGSIARTSCLAVALWLPLANIGAQCPDGTPPPCRAIADPSRAPIPALDNATWIVLPFDNTARANDVAWLREGSVNLLSMDLGRWEDIRVVDDRRVFDLLRRLPAAAQGRSLTLDDGLVAARSARAGKMVMGSFVSIGGRVRLSADVYNVQNGQRIRTVHEETTTADSLLSIFGRIAQGVLALALVLARTRRGRNGGGRRRGVSLE